ncbi:TnsA-like heteromeric transposase endonuclease subunit [Streptomyces sp. NPDC092903]|uniref:TnsA-like heteromeric transposase endonuclease subunit n=1 Tax=Streptomyces sp. NPDC092903 TaxID=3366017 RepID=UPI003817A57E
MGEPVGAYGDPALSAFDLDFFDTGRRRRTALGSGWDVRCEDVAPVREFRWNTGGRGFAGWYYAVTTGSHVGYESWLERDLLILLNFAPCGGIASQPFWLHWREAEVKRRHAPDYFVRLADGRARVVDGGVGSRCSPGASGPDRWCDVAVLDWCPCLSLPVLFTETTRTPADEEPAHAS